MNIFEKAKIIQFHKERLKTGRTDLNKLGWRSPESQQKRFEILLSAGDLEGKTILDLGCGYGDLKNFIDAKYNDVKYIGVDMLPEFVNDAAKRFTYDQNACFILGDFSGMELPEADYVFACGALCYCSKDPDYYYKMIRKMYAVAKYAIVFNMLDDQVFPKHPILKAHNKNEILSFCSSISTRVELTDGYLEDDFTISIFKDK